MTREEAITVLKAFMDNPLFSKIHKAAFSIAIHDIKQRHDWDINKLMLVPKTGWEQEPILDKITEIIEPLRHLSIDEMSNIEWQILQVIDKYKGESENP